MANEKLAVILYTTFRVDQGRKARKQCAEEKSQQFAFPTGLRI
jgi:hypothetical protein